MKLINTDEYDEEYGCCLFVSFSRDEKGNILGEPPEVCFSSGYLEDDFDGEKWTHFVKGDFNFMFSDVDPINYPKISIN